MSVKLLDLVMQYPRAECPVLDGVSLQVEEGAWVAIAGPNGCGKSTLLKVAAGIIKPRQGTVSVASPLAWVSGELRALYGRLTVAQNLEFFAHLAGATMEDVARLGQQLALEPYLATRAGELSMGTAARAILACGLLRKPQVLLLDELERSADAGHRERMLEMVEELTEAGGTVLWATHHPDVLARAPSVFRFPGSST